MMSSLLLLRSIIRRKQQQRIIISCCHHNNYYDYQLHPCCHHDDVNYWTYYYYSKNKHNNNTNNPMITIMMSYRHNDNDDYYCNKMNSNNNNVMMMNMNNNRHHHIICNKQTQRRSMTTTTTTTNDTRKTTTTSMNDKNMNDHKLKHLLNLVNTTNNNNEKKNIIIIGGGIIGVNVAYHIGKILNLNNNKYNIILLEQNQLTSGTTWHAAGLMTSFGSLNSTSISLRQYTKELYTNIIPNELLLINSNTTNNIDEDNNNYNNKNDPKSSLYDIVGYKNLGFIELATNNDRLHYLRRVASYNNYCGIPVIEMNVNELLEKDLLPSYINTNDIISSFYSVTDGRINPVDITMSIAKVAKTLYNVHIYEGITVTGIVTEDNDNDSNKKKHIYYHNLPKTITGVKIKVTNDNNYNQKQSSDDHQHDEKKQEVEEYIIPADIVINCTGMWARQLHNDMSNNNHNNTIVPLQSCEHYYLLTDDIPDEYKQLDHHNMPIIEDPDHYIYIRPEGNGLLIGYFEKYGQSWNATNTKTTTSVNQDKYIEIEPNWDRMMPYIEHSLSKRFHSDFISKLGMKQLFCGPESFTSDNQPIIGPVSSQYNNYYIAAGMNSIGILTGGGVGNLVANWILNNHISPINIDITGIHVNRYGYHNQHQNNILYRQNRTSIEALGNIYELHYPDHTSKTCRNIKKSSLHDRLLDQQGAYFKNVSEYESPLYYNHIYNNHDLKDNMASSLSSLPIPSSTTTLQKEHKSPIEFDNNDNHGNNNHGTFGKPHYFDQWKKEHTACRNDVGLFDMSFMGKFLLCGDDAGLFLNYLSTANIISQDNNNDNKIVYTQWLNELGYIEADVTIAPFQHHDHHNAYMVVVTDTMHHQCLSHMKKQLYKYQNKYPNVYIIDITNQYTQINIQGPKSRILLQSLCPYEDISNDNFRYRSIRQLEMGLSNIICSRITYIGELGYELYLPIEYSTYVYDYMIQKSIEHNIPLQHAGLKALQSLRMEKGYRDYGHDIDNTDTVIDVGLSFTCDFNKDEYGFIGQEYVLQQKEINRQYGGPKRRMVHVYVPTLLKDDNDTLLYHGEIIYRNSIPMGYIRSSSYGHTVNGGVGLSMIEFLPSSATDITVPITKEFLNTGEWEIDIAGKRYPCQVSLKPFYDPNNERIRM